MSKITVLYITICNSGGAAFSLINMIHALRESVQPIVLLPRREGIYERLVAEGIETIIVPYREGCVNLLQFSSMSPLRKIANIAGWIRDIIRWNMPFKQRVARVLKDRKIDVVHSNISTITVGVPLARSLHAKHVWHIRELMEQGLGLYPVFGWRHYMRLIDYSDAVIGITRAVASQRGILNQHKKATYIWNAIAPSHVAVYERYKESYIFFAAAAIAPVKGLPDLLMAYTASELPKRGIRIKIAGKFYDESYHAEIDKLIDSLGIGHYIDWIGFCNDLKPVMSKAVAFVMPSLFEGLGRVAVEAMFYGCPVIARNSGGPKEFMQHEDNGLVFDTTEELTALLNRVVTENQEQMVMRAQDFAIKNFSEEQYGEKIMDVYRNVL